jgi:hypothetical protein
MADRTGFEHDLAEAVAAATREARLAPAGDVIRLGRRRSRARRGRMAVAGVAVLGGAYGAVGFVGSAPAPKQGTASPAASGGAHGDGMLPVAKWPWDSTGHWQVSEGPRYYGVAPWLLSPAKDSPPNGPGATFARVGCEKVTVPGLEHYVEGRPRATVRGWTTPPRGKTAPYPPEAGDSVYTYPEAADAQQALTDTLNALKQTCGGGDLTVDHGATADYGVSWVLRVKHPENGTVEVDHKYLVVSGDRVSMFSVSDTSDRFADTAGDAKVLAEMRAALGG